MSTAILITYDDEDAISEAIALCEAAGYKVVHIVRQKFLKRQKYGISEEIIERVENIAKNLRPDVIIYDEVLKPSQNYNLASKFHRNILDRETLILEIFERRASSSESKLQVKLAQMRYEMGRAKEKVRLAKMGEQPGFMGVGKFEVDVYYNDIRNRMNTVKAKLVKAGKQRDLHRQGRKRLGFKTISLAGYTSAGKTTLFNRLTGEFREESTELFTTLSTTTRRVDIEEQAYLISDTVGFISKLPAYMIEAFKSTLEELIYTDVVIAVIDISDKKTDLHKKYKSCLHTLTQLGVEKNRLLFALNKADIISDDELKDKVKFLNLDKNERWINVSAKTGKNIMNLKKLIKNIIDSEKPQPLKTKSLKEELRNIYGN
ncbi:MAG: GTPase HflX [Nitrosopumilaceae archaeon]|nr:GTPase HflX [Nitrosopumilaceae archaeon]